MKVSEKIKQAYASMKEGKQTGKKISGRGGGDEDKVYSKSEKKWAKKAWDTMQENKHIPFVERMLMDNPPMYAQDKEEKEPSYSTHLMSTTRLDGKETAVPTLGFYGNGFVKDESLNTQIDKGDYLKFKRKKAARKFAEGSWKDALDINRSKP